MDEDDEDLYGSGAIGVTRAPEQRDSQATNTVRPKEGNIEADDDEGEAIEEDSDSVSR